ncbi:type II toxin-antitoxin system RelE/ParE family toxin [uncultured Parasphingorhabdus sp.]|uniref:type II toxin-antitoxin system RelE/ParE family toxin n=1 Tax=uncultured Parasphingorhabdus sp. TaxID=2709694 RepID=UPI0030DD4C17|tara:strand:+ start:33299 stop:33595 length:297 start_codon:yes stop_codon:yes gene_type:complete
MSYDIRFRPEALADLEDIADYTIERWGSKQARSYISSLGADIKSLSDFALRFPEHEPSGLGLRKMTSGHHLVFYLIDGEIVEIIRILHERIDVGGQIS